MGIAETKVKQIPRESERRGYGEAENSMNTQGNEKDWVCRSEKQCKYPQHRKCMGIRKQKPVCIPKMRNTIGYAEIIAE